MEALRRVFHCRANVANAFGCEKVDWVLASRNSTVLMTQLPAFLVTAINLSTLVFVHKCPPRGQGEEEDKV